MPDPYPASQFGGKVQPNTIQPPVRPDGRAGHEPTAHEKMMLMYKAGQNPDTVDSTVPFDGGESWDGLLPEEEAMALQPPVRMAEEE